jgi:hypothetical protein
MERKQVRYLIGVQLDKIHFMRSIVLIVLINFVSIRAFCQNNLLTVLRQSEILTSYYELTAAGAKILYLPMDFGGSTFSSDQEQAISILKNAQIARIDLVYSDYPAKADFSPLTRKRLLALQKALPAVFANKNIQIRKIRQTIGSTRSVAAGLQHGFFIYYRPLPGKGSGTAEVTKLTSLLRTTPSASIDSLTEARIGSEVGFCWQTTIVEDTLQALIPTLEAGYTRTITKIAIKEAVSRGLIAKDAEKEYLTISDSAFSVEDRLDGGCEMADYSVFESTDSTVTQIFKRHKWAHAIIIADVTGSMYPYTAQLLKWLQLNLTDKQTKYFVFFNDGDDKDDDKKVIGHTGGIYSVATNSYDEVENTVTMAMRNGSGGDLPENNIEALLASDELCKSCDSIVMIVDNWAPIKDISLLTAYHKPVKVVICGVFDKINKDYLKLARDTKGSIHLIEQDIYSLAELKEGQTIKIHGITYKLVDGNFVDEAGYKKTM